MDTLADRVARRRVERKLTQQQLAAVCDCHISTISDIERGKSTVVTSRILDALSVALDVEIDWLVKGKTRAHGGAKR